MLKRELVTRILEAAPIRVRPLLRRLLRAPASGGAVRPVMPLILGIDAGGAEEVSVMWKRHPDGRLELTSVSPFHSIRGLEVHGYDPANPSIRAFAADGSEVRPPVVSPHPVQKIETLYVGEKRIDFPYATTAEDALRAARRAHHREAAAYVPSYERERRWRDHAEIARMFAVPPSVLRPGDSSPFRAIEELRSEIMLQSLQAHVRRLDRKLLARVAEVRSRRAEEAVILLTYRLRQKAFGAQWIELSRRYAARQDAYAAKHGAPYDVRRASAFVDHVFRFVL